MEVDDTQHVSDLENCAKTLLPLLTAQTHQGMCP